jgi:hypothetical protein
MFFSCEKLDTIKINRIYIENIMKMMFDAILTVRHEHLFLLNGKYI